MADVESSKNFTFERVIEILIDRDGMSINEVTDFFKIDIEDAWFGDEH